MIQVSACLGTNREVNEEENGGAPAYNEKKEDSTLEGIWLGE